MIYCNTFDLHQLNFDEVKQNMEDFTFSEMLMSGKNRLWEYDSSKARFTTSYMSMVYLTELERIFVVGNEFLRSNFKRFVTKVENDNILKKSRECGIYDLKSGR